MKIRSITSLLLKINYNLIKRDYNNLVYYYFILINSLLFNNAFIYKIYEYFFKSTSVEYP